MRSRAALHRYLLSCCRDAYKYIKTPNANLISKHFRYS